MYLRSCKNKNGVTIVNIYKMEPDGLRWRLDAGRGGKSILGGGKGICKDPEIIWNLLNQRGREKTSGPGGGWRGG